MVWLCSKAFQDEKPWGCMSMKGRHRGVFVRPLYPGRVLDHGHLVWVKKYVLGGAAHSGKVAVLHGMNLVWSVLEEHPRCHHAGCSVAMPVASCLRERGQVISIERPDS